MLHIPCEHCGKIHPVYPNELKRGRGQFCSNECKKIYNYRIKTKRVCPSCGHEFWSYIDTRIYCCIECETAA